MSDDTTTEEGQRGTKLRSAFLHECFDYLAREQGFPGVIVSPSFKQESIGTLYFPELREGVLTYEFALDEWESPGTGTEGGENLVIELTDKETFMLRPGDDDTYFWNFVLLHAEEIGECLDFLENGRESKTRKISYREFSLNTVIEEVFLVLVIRGEFQFVPFRIQAIDKACPELLAKLRHPFDINSENPHRSASYLWWGWIEALTEEGKLDLDSLPGLEDALLSDYIYSPDSGDLFTVRKQQFVRNSHAVDSIGPLFGIRLKKEISPMYFWNFVHFYSEGEGFLKTLFERWKELPGILGKEQIKLPTSKLSQTQRAIEFRTALLEYREEIDALQRIREPEADIVTLYRKRIEFADFSRTEYAQEVQILQNPLPFLIEWPYRRFRCGNDRLERIKFAQQLLNILAKLAVFLPLEELFAAEAEVESQWRSFDEEFRGKPASDGTLVDIHKRMSKALVGVDSKLTVFRGLIRSLAELDSGHFQALVKARNDFHHPPYDETKFLRVCDAHFDQVVSAFRDGLRSVVFIIPKGMQLKDGKKLIEATYAMGYETDFQDKEIEVRAPFESFPTGELLAFNTQFQTSLVLKRYFKQVSITSNSIDFGLFDKVKAGKASFAFIRQQSRPEADSSK